MSALPYQYLRAALEKRPESVTSSRRGNSDEGGKPHEYHEVNDTTKRNILVAATWIVVIKQSLGC